MKNRRKKQLGVIAPVTDRDRSGHVSRSATYVLYNVDTGEEVERFEVDGRKMPGKDDWVKLYQDFAAEIAGAAKLSPLQYKLLFLILARAGFGNHLTICLADVARSWNASREALSRALRGLAAIRTVERLRSRKGTVSVRLNPNFAWKGSDRLRQARTKRWAEEHQPAGENPDLNEGTA